MAVQRGVQVRAAPGDHEGVRPGEVDPRSRRVREAHARARALEPAAVGAWLLATEEDEHGRAGVALELAAGDEQALPRPGHALARGLLRDAEPLAELAQGEPGLEAQEQGEALVGGEGRERLLETEWIAHAGAGRSGSRGTRRRRRRSSSSARLTAVRCSQARNRSGSASRGAARQARTSVSWRRSSAVPRSPTMRRMRRVSGSLCSVRTLSKLIVS